MTRRSMAGTARHERDRSGCMWGLIDLFDFRRGRTNQKLLSDKRREGRHVAGAGYPESKDKVLAYVDDKCHATDDVIYAAKPIVKNFVEEEMFTKKDLNKPTESPELEQEQFDLQPKGLMEKNYTNSKLIDEKKNNNLCTHGPNAVEILGSKIPSRLDMENQSINNLKIDAMVQELCFQILPNHQQDEIHMQSKESHFEIICEAARILVSEKLDDEMHLKERKKISKHEEFTDSWEALVSNKELLLRLVQDPNSQLVKHIRKLLDSSQGAEDKESKSFAVSSFSEQESAKLRKNEELVSHKHRKLLRRKFKSWERNLSHEDEKSQPSNKIVILKPRPACLQSFDTQIALDSHYLVKNNRSKAASHFSITETKRKLRSPFRKGQRDASKDDAQNSGKRPEEASEKRVGRHFPSWNKHVKKGGERAAYRTDNSEVEVEYEEGDHSKKRVSNIDAEVSKLLSEMPSPLTRASEICDGGFDDDPEFEVQILNSESDVCNELVHDSIVELTVCSSTDEIRSEGDVEVIRATDGVGQEENEVLIGSCELSGSANTRHDHATCNDDLSDGNGYSKCLKLEQDGLQENEPPSSPSKCETAENIIDITERPSPVSVLEPLLSEDDVSPRSTKSLPGEPSIPPLHIQFEQEISATYEGIQTKINTSDKEYIFQYVKAVLEASGLDWDGFFLKLLSSDELLDPLVFEMVEFDLDRSSSELKLLFDCINEVLVEICERYYSCCPWISSTKPMLRLVPTKENTIFAVFEGVNWHLLPGLPPRSVDQIVEEDLAKNGRWMDLRFNAEYVAMELGQVILDELVEDTLFCCVNVESGEDETDPYF